MTHMAKLCEQRRLVRAILNYPETKGSLQGLDTQEFFERNWDASRGMVSDDNLMLYCGKTKIFNADSVGCLADLPEAEKLTRKHKLNILRKSCEDRLFIEPIKETVSVEDWDGFDGITLKKKIIEVTSGWTITDRGSDLLGWWGFCSIAFEKHSKLIHFLWGAVTGVIGSGIVWIIMHWTQIAHLFGF